MARIKSFSTLRSSAVLTGSYVGSTAVECSKDVNEVVFFVDFTIGSLTTAEIKAQYSDDQSTWFDDTLINTAGGSTSSDEYLSPLRVNVVQLSATATKALAIPAMARYVRLAIKGTGTVTNSLAAIYAYTGEV